MSRELEAEYRKLLERLGLEREPRPDGVRSIAAAQIREYRMEATFSGDRALPRELLARIREQYVRAETQGDTPLDAAIELLQNQLVRNLEAADMHPPKPFLFKCLPTGKLNAEAVTTDAGVIILMNAGLLMLLFQSAKVFFKSRHLSSETEDGGVSHIHAQLTEAQAIDCMGDIQLAYFRHGSTTYAARLPASLKETTLVTLKVVQYAEQFIVGHEYAHVHRRHLDIVDNRSTPLQQEGYWALETDADKLAWYLTVPAELWKMESRESFDDMCRLVAGISLLFNALKLTLQVGERVFNWQENREHHPPIDLRYRKVKAEMKESGLSEEFFYLADRIDQWYETLLEPVTECVRRGAQSSP